MTLAFTFPGQGSQAVGMGRQLSDQYSVAKAVFDEVDEALGEKLSTLMFEGPDDALTLTANTQPALMAVSVAITRVLESQGFDLKSRVAFVAGHSLGEYAAHAVAGTFALADTARLLRIRGNAMQAAVPVGIGAMAAIIGLEDIQVEQICRDAASSTKGAVCQIANDNGGGQLVISGDKEAVELAAEAAKEAGAKRALILPVSAPFHCALMQPAAEAMAVALSKISVNSPSIPVVTNVGVMPESNPSALVDLLVKQVTGQVRWRETIQWFGKNGVTHLAEIGSGKVLTGLARRIDSQIAGVAINAQADIEAFLQAHA
ncbi:MAG: ACP S-malonyltransferase [Ahrensia sp.]|nr:ACP S-malonyltransferase [Ahrensia sp.]